MKRLPRRATRQRSNADGGRRIKIPPHPPSFVSMPWYNLVVRFENASANFTTVNLRDGIHSQFGGATTSNLDVRLQSVKFWGALIPPGSTTPLAPISVLVSDPIGLLNTPGSGIGPRVLEQLIDYPDQLSRAAIGYHYPKAQRETSIRLTGTNLGSLFLLNGFGTNSVIYVYLQWRFALSAAPSVDEALRRLQMSADGESEEDADRFVLCGSPRNAPRRRNHLG